MLVSDQFERLVLWVEISLHVLICSSLDFVSTSIAREQEVTSSLLLLIKATLILNH